MTKTAYFRADASLNIGTGHIYRCLVLAKQLKRHQIDSIFLCRPLKGNSIEFIEKQGFEVIIIPETEITRPSIKNEIHFLLQAQQIQPKSQYLIVDHYQLDETWEKSFRTVFDKIMVIDDLSNRNHDCDLLLDQNYHPNPEKKYHGLIPTHCQKLMGPKYCLLREDFQKERKQVQRDYSTLNPSCLKFITCFGGIDTTGETIKVIDAFQQLNLSSASLNVVIGQNNPRRDEIKSICHQNNNLHFFCQIDNMAELLAKSDLAIGAGGTSTWERLCLGLPSLLAILADNQVDLIQQLSQKGAVVNLGNYLEVSSQIIVQQIQKLLNDPQKLQQMSQLGMELVDGLGAKRVVSILLDNPF